MIAHLLARANFFPKKNTHAGSLVNTTLPAYCIYYLSLRNFQWSYLAQWAQTINRKQFSAQKRQNTEDTVLLYYIAKVY